MYSRPSVSRTTEPEPSTIISAPVRSCCPSTVNGWKTCARSVLRIPVRIAVSCAFCEPLHIRGVASRVSRTRRTRRKQGLRDATGREEPEEKWSCGTRQVAKNPRKRQDLRDATGRASEQPQTRDLLGVTVARSAGGGDRVTTPAAVSPEPGTQKLSQPRQTRDTRQSRRRSCSDPRATGRALQGPSEADSRSENKRHSREQASLRSRQLQNGGQEQVGRPTSKRPHHHAERLPPDPPDRDVLDLEELVDARGASPRARCRTP